MYKAQYLHALGATFGMTGISTFWLSNTTDGGFTSDPGYMPVQTQAPPSQPIPIPSTHPHKEGQEAEEARNANQSTNPAFTMPSGNAWDNLIATGFTLNQWPK